MVKIETCEITKVHDNVVSKVKEKMPDTELLYDVAELFKIFGDSTRLNILVGLLENEMCVCDIGCLLNMTKSAVSHQLRILRQAKLVKFKKVGKEVIYSLADDHVREIIDTAIEHIME